MRTQNGKPYKTGEFALTPTEYERILSVCGSIEDEVLIKFAVATGLRRADIVRVLLLNVNTENGLCIYSEKKKGDRIRSIYVGPLLRQLLIKYIRTLPKDQKRLFGFSERTAYNKLQRLCVLAGIPARPFHSLRATCIKRCQKAGWTLEQVADLTGDTIRVIQEHYSVPSGSEMSELAQVREII